MSDAPCSKKACNDMATVLLERDGRPYCRPHGLAEALRLPRCEIRDIPAEFTPPEVDHCKSCRSACQWVMLDTGKRMLLNRGRMRTARPGMVALNPRTGRGHVLTRADIAERLDGWLAAGVELREPHFTNCPYADQHRRSAA